MAKLWSKSGRLLRCSSGKLMGGDTCGCVAGYNNCTHAWAGIPYPYHPSERLTLAIDANFCACSNTPYYLPGGGLQNYVVKYTGGTVPVVEMPQSRTCGSNTSWFPAVPANPASGPWFEVWSSGTCASPTGKGSYPQASMTFNLFYRFAQARWEILAYWTQANHLGFGPIRTIVLFWGFTQPAPPWVTSTATMSMACGTNPIDTPLWGVPECFTLATSATATVSFIPGAAPLAMMAGPSPLAIEAQLASAGYDPEEERRRLQHGGCCGSPSDGMA